jgi:hypothetical protein
VKTDWYCLFSAAAFCLGVDSRLSFSFSVGILLVLLLAKKTKKTEDWKNYKTTEKNVKREIEKAHREYTDKLLNLNASENPKKFYSYIKSKRRIFEFVPDRFGICSSVIFFTEFV